MFYEDEFLVEGFVTWHFSVVEKNSLVEEPDFVIGDVYDPNSSVSFAV